MKKVFGFFIVALLSGCASAPVVVHKITNPLFWDIEKDGTHSYVLATLEVGVGIDELPDTVLGKLHASKVLVLAPYSVDELAVTKKDRAGIAEALHLPDGDSLDQQISPQAWAILVEILRGSFEPSTIKHWSPTLTLGVLKARRQSLHIGGEKAKNSKKPIRMREQLREIASADRYQILFPEDWHEYVAELHQFCDAKCLERFLLNPPPIRTATYDPNEVIANYRQGLADRITDKVTGEIQDEDHELVRARFKQWAGRLSKMQKGYGSLFIAMPLALVLGQGPTLLEALKTEGFQVSRTN